MSGELWLFALVGPCHGVLRGCSRVRIHVSFVFARVRSCSFVGALVAARARRLRGFSRRLPPTVPRRVGVGSLFFVVFVHRSLSAAAGSCACCESTQVAARSRFAGRGPFPTRSDVFLTSSLAVAEVTTCSVCHEVGHNSNSARKVRAPSRHMLSSHNALSARSIPRCVVGHGWAVRWSSCNASIAVQSPPG